MKGCTKAIFKLCKVLDKSYAERVPAEDMTRSDGHVRYIPHHAVFHPKKPGKIRIVHDCNAQYGGCSLNDHLLLGPDMANKLVGVLLRFRQEHVALTCDIEAMYHQFVVSKADRDLLRFLWWENGDMNKSPVDYRMAVHLFGASSSPACAMYCLRQIASDEREFSPEAAEFIRRNFYVDDGLRSVPDECSAISLAESRVKLCQKGGLRLCKFMSNSKSVLESIPKEDREDNAQAMNLVDNKLPTGRVLGVQWNANTDTLGFDIELQEKTLTRRGILSVVSQVYDPVGLTSPCILLGKQFLQDLCRENTDWEFPLSGDICVCWEKWIEELPQLQGLHVPRCYKPVPSWRVGLPKLYAPLLDW